MDSQYHKEINLEFSQNYNRLTNFLWPGRRINSLRTHYHSRGFFLSVWPAALPAMLFYDRDIFLSSSA